MIGGLFSSAINIVKSAATFLQSGVAPAGVSNELRQKMEDTNHFTSKKFFIVFSASILLAFFYFTSIGILFLLPHVPEVVTGYITMFVKTIEVLAVVIAFYTTGQAVVDLKYISSSNAGIQGNVSVIKEEITENLTHNIKEDDYELL